MTDLFCSAIIICCNWSRGRRQTGARSKQVRWAELSSLLQLAGARCCHGSSVIASVTAATLHCVIWHHVVAKLARSEINKCFSRNIPAMRPGFLLSCVWVSIQLVTVVSAEMTKSTCGMMRFKPAKSENEEALCATAPPPTAAISMETKLQCSWVCAHSGDTCAAGFNFKDQETVCEMFANPATTLELQQGCEHYTVCTSLTYAFYSFIVWIRWLLLARNEKFQNKTAIWIYTCYKYKCIKITNKKGNGKSPLVVKNIIRVHCSLSLRHVEQETHKNSKKTFEKTQKLLETQEAS